MKRQVLRRRASIRAFPRREPVNFLNRDFFRMTFVSDRRLIVVPERFWAVVFWEERQIGLERQFFHALRAWERDCWRGNEM